ncbi:MAG: hypothetical protein KBH11_09640 [Bacteroidia bacterium]|nr:hypothetical protein [Bacteroidia bacterium]
MKQNREKRYASWYTLNRIAVGDSVVNEKPVSCEDGLSVLAYYKKFTFI